MVIALENSRSRILYVVVHTVFPFIKISFIKIPPCLALCQGLEMLSSLVLILKVSYIQSTYFVIIQFIISSCYVINQGVDTFTTSYYEQHVLTRFM